MSRRPRRMPAAAAADGSIGAALDEGREGAVDAREAAAARCSRRPRRRILRVAGSTARSAGRAGSDRDELARRLRALASLLRDLGLLLSPRGRPRARQRRSQAAAPAAAPIVRQRSRDSRVFGRRPRARRARSQRQPEDSRGLGGASAVAADSSTSGSSTPSEALYPAV